MRDGEDRPTAHLQDAVLVGEVLLTLHIVQATLDPLVRRGQREGNQIARSERFVELVYLSRIERTGNPHPVAEAAIDAVEADQVEEERMRNQPLPHSLLRVLLE